jgi:phosphotransferase system enzyme I (PtsI)
MLQGLSVSPGVAVGRAVIIRFGGLPAFRRAVPPGELDKEERRLRRAASKAAEEFERHSREAKGDIGSELAAILESHGLIAED